MTNPFDEPVNTNRLKFTIVILLILIILWMVSVAYFFSEPEEPQQGIIVRFIVFFKQFVLI